MILAVALLAFVFLAGPTTSLLGAYLQNIGAYGAEFADVFLELTAFDLKSGKTVKIDRNQAEFGYRTSYFKDLQGAACESFFFV